MKLDTPVLRLSIAIIILILFEGLLLTLLVPAGGYGPEQMFLDQLGEVRAGRTAEGLYPHVASTGLASIGLVEADYVYALRLASMTFSGVTLLLLLLLIPIFFPQKPYLLPGTLLVLGAMPAFVLTMSQASPQALVMLLTVATLAAGLWMLRYGVSLLTLGGMLACFLLGMQLDWGFWWLAPALLLTILLAITLPGTERDRWMAQLAVIAGVGVTLFGIVTALRGAQQLIPLLNRTVIRVGDIIGKAAFPAPATVEDLVRRFWAGSTNPSRLWFAAILLWFAMSLYGLLRFIQQSSWHELSARQRVEWMLILAFGGSLLIGAVFVPGSIATWPAPFLGIAAPVLVVGWSHVVPAEARPQWLLLGLLGLALLNAAALLS